MCCSRYETMIIDMAAGELDLAGRRTLRAHILECPSCHRLLDETEELLERSRSALSIEPPPADMKRLRQAAATAARRPRRKVVGAVAVAASLLVAFAAGGLAGYHFAPAPSAEAVRPVHIVADTSSDFWRSALPLSLQRRQNRSGSPRAGKGFWTGNSAVERFREEIEARRGRRPTST